MPVNNGHIIFPVSVDDVRTLLRMSSTDLMTLCTATNINPFSKRKPVEPSNGEYVRESLGLPSEGFISSRSFKTIKENWGIKVVDEKGEQLVGALTLSEITERYGESGDSYTYLRPLTEKFHWVHERPVTVGRLTDFNGYYHNAVPMMYMDYDSNEISVSTVYDTIPFTVRINLSSDDYSLSIDEMKDFGIAGAGGTKLGDMYLLCVYDGASQGEVFSQYPIRNYKKGDTFEILLEGLESNSGSYGNTYDLYFCLATTNYWWTTNLFPLPDTSKFFRHLILKIFQKSIFAELTLTGIGATNVSLGLSTVDLRNVSYQSASYYDAYGSNPHTLYAPSGKGVVLRLTAVLKSDAGGYITVSPSLFQMRLNTAIQISAAVQITGTNSNCTTTPSTSVNTFNMVTGTTYTIYIVALDNVADNSEVQLSMSVSGHVNEGMQAATPWMNVLPS